MDFRFEYVPKGVQLQDVSIEIWQIELGKVALIGRLTVIA